MSTQSTPGHRRNFHHEEWRPPVMAETEISNVKRSATMTGEFFRYYQILISIFAAIPQAQKRHDILVESKTHQLWSHPMGLRFKLILQRNSLSSFLISQTG